MTTREEAQRLADALDVYSRSRPPTPMDIEQAAALLRQWPEAGVPGPLTLTQATAPREIWLQVSDSKGDSAEAFPDDTEGVTWCAESALLNEVRYVRADLAAPGAAQPARPDEFVCPHCLDEGAAPQAVPQPLTEAELELMWGKAASGEGRSGIGMYQTRLCALDFARAIEEHHGITAKEKP